MPISTKKRPEWQTIESAPPMKTLLLFGVTEGAEDGRVVNWKMATGYCSEGSKAWMWEGNFHKPYDHQPTHWLSLPDPPESGT